MRTGRAELSGSGFGAQRLHDTLVRTGAAMIDPVAEKAGRKGWCPGARRPMRSGDGLLLRIRPHGGRIAPDGARAVADLAERYGNGTIELTRRANLQLRGMDEACLPYAEAVLAELDLIDADVERESVRNIILSPLAGCDESAAFDGRRVLSALEERLAHDPRLHALPAKFSFLIDEGGRLPLGDVAADIRLTAASGRVLVSLGGDAATAKPVALIAQDRAAEAALDLARAFIGLAAPMNVRRMRDLVECIAPSALREEAGLPDTLPSLLQDRPVPFAAVDAIGARRGFVGVAAPFGTLAATQLSALADLADEDIRLTPWRILVLPGLEGSSLEPLSALGLIVEAGDSRLRIVACPGAPACASAEAPTRLPAAALASFVAALPGNGTALHVSGCAKGCASSAAAPFVAVALGGRYDLVVDGTADGIPAETGLSTEGLKAAIAARANADQRGAS